MDSFQLIVLVLLLLAVADLIVGVSNDAANFLNSAIGSRVASRRIILTVASLGVLLGALSSSGMMEIARKGVFDPSYFSFADVMVIFLAVMLADILLLDIYNSFGLPTSTTVSIVFEMLGAAVMVGWLKLMTGSTTAASLAEMINTSSLGRIVGGIFLSVIIAFTVGSLVMWATRLFFTFHMEDRMRRWGAPFAGLAISIIVFFMLVKGLKETDLMKGGFGLWVNAHIVRVMAGVFTVVSACCWWLQHRFRVDPLRIVVLTGTFSLAMAFAGNDLVNFIGVPITGLQSFQLWMASGVEADAYMMDAMAKAVRTPSYLLYIAGGVMVLTLWFSAKARKVSSTEVDLARKGEGEERFRSNLLARMLVRRATQAGDLFNRLLGRRSKVLLNKRFRSHGVEQREGASFDLLRAAMNLMVSSLLIAAATKLKLPLSTTFVTFMVAMGTSLADRAWGADTAAQRVAGVLNVIGGWLLTAVLAFGGAALMASLIYWGGNWAGIALFVLVSTYLLRSHMPRRLRSAGTDGSAADPVGA
ncbi:MAG: inorganic phosphate transporter [Flavobacteriales bacterium]